MSNKNLWFVARKYGWGWTPATWQGWLVVVTFFIYQFGLVAFIGNSFKDRAGITSFFFLTILGLILLLSVCYKFGEKPRWRFGN